MNILITGGAGFIGSTLADRLLKDGHIVTVVDNFNDYYSKELKIKNIQHNLSNEKYILYEEDIRNKAAIKNILKNNNIEVVIHIAALAGVRASIERPEEFVDVNVNGTKIILDSMIECNIKKLVFASSSSVYGNCEAKIFSENITNLQQISPYAKTKYQCEELIKTYFQLYNLSAVCLRLFTVFGPRQRPDLAIRKFIEQIKKDEPIIMYGDGTMSRDYTYIDDVINGFVSAIEYENSLFEIINIGSGSPVNLLKLVNIIEKCLDKKAIIKQVATQKGDVQKTYADIDKAKSLLNYTPQKDFEKGIRNFINWLETSNCFYKDM